MNVTKNPDNVDLESTEIWKAHMLYRERFDAIVPLEQMPMSLANSDQAQIDAINRCLKEGHPIEYYYPIRDDVIY